MRLPFGLNIKKDGDIITKAFCNKVGIIKPSIEMYLDDFAS